MIPKVLGVTGGSIMQLLIEIQDKHVRNTRIAEASNVCKEARKVAYCRYIISHIARTSCFGFQVVCYERK